MGVRANQTPSFTAENKKAFQAVCFGRLFYQWLVGRRDWTRTNDPHHVKVTMVGLQPACSLDLSMTMTSNYDKYIRPEVWPIPVEQVGYVFEGSNLPGGMVEIRCVGDHGHYVAGKVFILDSAPREHARGVTDAIVMYRNACLKLTS